MTKILETLDASAIVAIMMSFFTMVTSLLTLLVNECIRRKRERSEKRNKVIGDYISATGRDLTDSRDNSKAEYGKALGAIFAYANKEVRKDIIELDEYIRTRKTNDPEAKKLFIDICEKLNRK